MFRKGKAGAKLERNKVDDKIIECVMAGDAAKLRPLVEKKRYSSLYSADEQGRVPIYEACRLGFTECAEILLAAEPDATIYDDEGRTPLHVSALNGHTDCVTLLLKKGMNVDVVDKREQTPLHHAAIAGHVDVLQALIAFNADSERMDKDGNTPLLAASKANQRPTVVALMNASANINAHNRQQKTALMFACEHGASDLVQMLLQRGAQYDIKDTGGRTALSYARQFGHKACEEILPADAQVGSQSQPVDVSQPAANQRRTSNVSDQFPPPPRPAGGSGYSKMKEQIESLQRQLAKEQSSTAAAKNEVEQLKARLSAFVPDDDDDVTFGSDDELDLGDATPKKGGDDSTELKKLRLKVGSLTTEKERLSKEVEEKTSEVTQLKEQVDKFKDADATIAKLEATIADQEEQLQKTSGGLAVVPAFLFQQVQNEKAELEKRLQDLGGGMNGSGAAPTAKKSSPDETEKIVKAYRLQLLKAVKGTLDDATRAALLQLAEDADI